MALFGKLISVARSPQGRRLLSQAQKAARDPRNRERLQDVRTRFRAGKTVASADRQTADAPRGVDEAPGSGTPPKA